MPHPVLLPRLLLGSTNKHRLERGLEPYCFGFILDRGLWSRALSYPSSHCIFSGWSSAQLCAPCSDLCFLSSLRSFSWLLASSLHLSLRWFCLLLALPHKLFTYLYRRLLNEQNIWGFPKFNLNIRWWRLFNSLHQMRNA